MTRSRRLCVTSLLVVLAVGTARGDEAHDVAQKHVDHGLRLYDIAKYAEAIAELKTGYEIEPRPEILYTIGQAERLRGDCKKAIEAYRAFLRSHPVAKRASSARQNIARCQTELAQAPPPPPPEPPPVVAPPPSPPPVAAVVVPPSAAPQAERRWYHDWVGATLVSAGVAALAVGAGLWAVGNQRIDDANTAPRYDQFATAASGEGGAQSLQAAGITCVAAGLVSIAAGATRYLLLGRAERRRAATISAAVSPAGGALFMTTRF
jgi:hypothetical protein